MLPERRVFLADGLVALMGAGVLCSGLATGCANRPAREVSLSGRRRLDEPGPMLPPVPAVLLTVAGADGQPDEVSVVWTFVLNGTPPQIGISVGHEHLAQHMVAKQRDFVLNVPGRDIVDAFDIVDMNSDRSEDKYALSGLTRGEAVAVAAPTIAEAKIHVECRVSHEVDLPPSRRVFFADVLATTVLPDVCDADGRLDVTRADIFGMTAGSGEFYTMGESIGHIGKSVGRTDIKY